jgi:hypothetical protein
MPLKKYITWAIAAFVIFYLLRSPTNAAHVVQSVADKIAWAANSLTRFVNELA